nr:uncharacterized protein LOC110089292 [Pogona vitticeps]
MASGRLVSLGVQTATPSTRAAAVGRRKRRVASHSPPAGRASHCQPPAMQPVGKEGNGHFFRFSILGKGATGKTSEDHPKGFEGTEPEAKAQQNLPPQRPGRHGLGTRWVSQRKPSHEGWGRCCQGGSPPPIRVSTGQQQEAQEPSFGKGLLKASRGLTLLSTPASGAVSEGLTENGSHSGRKNAGAKRVCERCSRNPPGGRTSEKDKGSSSAGGASEDSETQTGTHTPACLAEKGTPPLQTWAVPAPFTCRGKAGRRRLAGIPVHLKDFHAPPPAVCSRERRSFKATKRSSQSEADAGPTFHHLGGTKVPRGLPPTRTAQGASSSWAPEAHPPPTSSQATTGQSEASLGGFPRSIDSKTYERSGARHDHLGQRPEQLNYRKTFTPSCFQAAGGNRGLQNPLTTFILGGGPPEVLRTGLGAAPSLA